MTDKITFKDKNGNPKYIADSKGNVYQVEKDGKLKNIIVHEKPETNKKTKDN